MGLYGPVTSADVDRVEEFYRSRGVPCEIVVSPLADRSLLEVLAPRGYRITEFNSVLIRRLEANELVEPATGITVERVTEATAAALGPRDCQGICGIRPAARKSLRGLCHRCPTRSAFWRGWMDNPPGERWAPSCGEAGIAALFGTATLPEFRRRGVQTALINRRLWEAAQGRAASTRSSVRCPAAVRSAIWSGAAFAWPTPSW